MSTIYLAWYWAMQLVSSTCTIMKSMTTSSQASWLFHINLGTIIIIIILASVTIQSCMTTITLLC